VAGCGGGGVSQTVADLDFDFEEALSIAQDKARGAWEEQFVSDLQDRFDEYADRMFISDRQVEVLLRITGDV
jgi:hypothetical protein